jgi:hypothetical protein
MQCISTHSLRTPHPPFLTSGPDTAPTSPGASPPRPHKTPAGSSLVVSSSNPPNLHSIEGVTKIAAGRRYEWCSESGGELRNAVAVYIRKLVNVRPKVKGRRTATLLIPHPIQSSFPFPFIDPGLAAPPPILHSRMTSTSGLARSVAIYTCVSVSTESIYRILIPVS